MIVRDIYRVSFVVFGVIFFIYWMVVRFRFWGRGREYVGGYGVLGYYVCNC